MGTEKSCMRWRQQLTSNRICVAVVSLHLIELDDHRSYLFIYRVMCVRQSIPHWQHRQALRKDPSTIPLCETTWIHVHSTPGSDKSLTKCSPLIAFARTTWIFRSSDTQYGSSHLYTQRASDRGGSTTENITWSTR